ncbi:MAG: Wzz/FepE/Etk N-terminal domain-containing protein [Phycisphaerales bacterium]
MADIQTESPMSSSTRIVTDDEIDLFNYLCAIWHHRWMIFLLCVVAMALAVVLSMSRPRQYEATVTIVPPLDILQKESIGGAGMASNPLFRQVFDTAASSITNMYIEILSSREVADAVIDRFHLMTVYSDIKYRADARRQLKQSTKIETTPGRAVKIAVRDRDPNLAVAIAIAYVEELDRQNKRLSGGQATSKRVFLENRLKEVEAKLSKIDNILSREAKIQEGLYELLVQQYEMAKIEEANSMPTINVLDSPVVPELGIARGTVQKGVMAGVAAFIFGVFLAFTREYVLQTRRRRAGVKAARPECRTAAGSIAPTGEYRS